MPPESTTPPTETPSPTPPLTPPSTSPPTTTTTKTLMPKQNAPSVPVQVYVTNNAYSLPYATEYADFTALIDQVLTLAKSPRSVWEYPRGQKRNQNLHGNPPPGSFYFTAATFAEPVQGRRHEYVTGGSVVLFDLDDTTNANQLLGLIESNKSPLHRYNYIAYHTFSSTASEPRLRLIIELAPAARPSITPAYYRQVILDLGNELSFLIKERDDTTMLDMSHPQGSPMYPADYPEDRPKIAGWSNNGQAYSPQEADPYKYYAKDDESEIEESPDLNANPLLKQQIIDAAMNIPLEELDSYRGWHRAGAMIHHAFGGKDEGLEVWLATSKRSSAFDNQTTKLAQKYYAEYSSARAGGATYRSLLWFHAPETRMGGSFMTDVMTEIKNTADTSDLLAEDSAIRRVAKSIRNSKVTDMIAAIAHKRAKQLDAEFLVSLADMKNLYKEHLSAEATENMKRASEQAEVVIEKLPFYNDHIYVAERDAFFPVALNSARSTSESIMLYSPEQMFAKYSNLFQQKPLDRMFANDILSEKANATIIDESMVKQFLRQHSLKVDQMSFDPSREPFYAAKFEYENGGTQEQKAINAYRKGNIAAAANYEELTKADQNEVDRLTAYIEFIYTRSNGSTDDLAILAYFMHSVTTAPENKMLWCLVVCSRAQGIGKSMLGGMMCSVLSPRYSSSIQGLGQLLGDHNIYLENKLLLSLDDITMSVHKEAERARYNTRVKPLITLKTMMVNPKGVDQYTSPNFVNLYMTSNQEVCVPLDVEDRRHAILSPGTTKQEAYDYAEQWVRDHPERAIPTAKTDPEKPHEAFYDDIEYIIDTRPELVALVIATLYNRYAHLGANGRPISHRHAPDTPAKKYVISQTLDESQEGAYNLTKLHQMGELPDFFTHHEVREACKRTDMEMPITFESNKGRGQIFRASTNIAKLHKRYAYNPPQMAGDAKTQMTYFASPSVSSEEVVNMLAMDNKTVQDTLDGVISNFWEGTTQAPRAALTTPPVPTAVSQERAAEEFAEKLAEHDIEDEEPNKSFPWKKH